MLTLLFILLVTAHAGLGLQCITNCSLTKIPFGEALRVRAAQCQQRVTRSTCTVDITLKFDTKQYSATFGESPDDAEKIYISPGLPLDYDFSVQCLTETDCVMRDAQKRIDALVRRFYSAAAVYEEIAPLITDPLVVDRVKCFNAKSDLVTCASGEMCITEYDQIARQVRSRGCAIGSSARVYVYDSPTYASFTIVCKRDLCNGDTTYNRVKDILNRNSLVHANGRILGSAGSISVIPSLSIMLAVTLALFHLG